jgi:hypothetical protein
MEIDLTNVDPTRGACMIRTAEDEVTAVARAGHGRSHPALQNLAQKQENAEQRRGGPPGHRGNLESI